VVHYEKQNAESETVNGTQELGGKQCYINHERNVININDLFVQCETAYHPYIILIEGAPDIGKTTLSKEIGIQWANHTLLKSQMLLFVVFMGDPQLKFITDTNSLVNYFYNNENDSLCNKVIGWLNETDGEYLTIILDGYDEVYDANKSAFINDIIAHKSLPKCSLVITSRTVASLYLHSVVDCKAEVSYLTEECRKDFIKNALQGKIVEMDELEVLLQSNPYLNTLCYLPSTLNMLLCLIELGTRISELPRTQTKLVEKFIMMTINQFLIRQHGTTRTGINYFNELPNSYQQVVNELAKLAFYGLRKDRLMFTKVEINEICPSLYSTDIFGLGMLKVVKYSKPWNNKLYCFLNFSIQEYMAAYHITSLTNTSQLKLLTEMFGNIHFLNTWEMYVSLTSSHDFVFKHFLSGNSLRMSSRLFKVTKISDDLMRDKIKCMHLLHCLTEADHEMLPTVKYIFQEGIIDLKNKKLSSNDVMTLIFLLIRLPGKQWEKINLPHCGIDNKSCNIFFKTYRHGVQPLVKFIDFSFNDFDWESVKRLSVIVRSWQTKELALSIDELYDSSTQNKSNHITRLLQEKIQPGFVDSILRIGLPNVQKNTLANILTNANAMLKGGMLLVTYVAVKNAVFIVYSDPDILYTNFFQFGGRKLRDDMIEEVIAFVNDAIKARVTVVFSHTITDHREKSSLFSGFETIKLNGSNMHSKYAYLLSNNVQIKDDFKYLFQYVADYLTAAVCYSFQTGSSYLQMVSGQDAEKVKTTIESHPNLMRIVNISSSSINSEAAGDLSVIFNKATLQYFYIQNNQLGSTGAIKIAKALHRTTSLIEFDISGNDIGSEAAGDIAAVLSNNNKLQKFSTSKNSLETFGGLKITRALQNTSSLIEFDISCNNIGSEAANDVALVLSRNTKLQALYIQDNNLETLGAIAIAKALQTVASLRELDISSNNISSEAADEIAAVLSRNVKLKRLCIKENNLGSSGTIKIASALYKTSTLVEFDISSNNIGSKAASEVAAVVSHNVKLVKLCIRENDLGPLGAVKIVTALRKASSLIEFDISSNNIGSEAADDVAVLSRNNKIQVLCIQNNNLAKSGAIKIAKALRVVSSLNELNISNNNIGSEAADDIAAVLSHNVGMQKLYIKENNLQTSGANKITRALVNTSSLIEFDISNNNVGGEAASGIATVLSHNVKLQKFCTWKNNLKTIGAKLVLGALEKLWTLTELNIANNSIGSEAADNVAAVLSSNTKMQVFHIEENDLNTSGTIKIAKGLQNISSLTELDISSNNIGIEAADDIAAVLSLNTKLQKFHIRQNNLQTSGTIKIARALQDTSSLLEFNISTNNIGSDAASTIEAVLSRSSKLQKFYAKGNNFQTFDAIKIAAALQTASSLVIFDISNNNVSSEAVKDIAAILCHKVNLLV